MNICKLSQYQEMRRPHEKKTPQSWTRAAKAGKIPGAFQYTNGGDWFVDLDIHDEVVRQKIVNQSEQPQTLLQSLPDDIRRMAIRLNLTEEDIRIAMRAAGVKALK